MSFQHLVMIGAAVLALSARAGHAGPCAEAIDQAQDALDARIEAAIDAARFARDARRAFGLPAPSQGALATTGGADDGASWMGQAVAALARARDADRDGDSIACEQALGDVKRAISR
jgi:hypothetical protein